MLRLRCFSPVLLLVILAGAVACHETPGPVAPSAVEESESLPPPEEEATSPADGLETTATPDPAPHQDEVIEEPEPATTPVAAPQRHPLDGVDEAEVERRLLEDPESLGAMSVGRPNAGRLINGVQLPEHEYWERIAPYGAWATEETIQYLKDSLAQVHARFPNTPKIHIGDISLPSGGHFKPHLSHQAGRDVDIAFFYSDGSTWYRRGTAKNLDLDRTWAFVRALITQSDLRFILVDYSIQKLLRDHATSIGEDPDWLEAVFKGSPGRPALIRHAPGHATHMHIRFYNPIAQETARRCYKALIKHKRVKPPTYYTLHKVRRGETLGKIAKRFGTTVKAIQRANGLRKTLIRAGRVYRIPRKGDAPPPPKVAIPPRLVPPA